MAKLFNLARMTTTTTGTGAIILGAAVSGCLSFALAGAVNGDVVSYGISDGANSEIGTGVYSTTGPTLTRSVTKSTNSNAAISLSGTAQVFITARAEDFPNISTAGLATGGPITDTGTITVTAATQTTQEAATSNTVAVTPGTQQYHPSSPKAWVRFNAGGGIIASYNVSSVTRTSAGAYVVNFTTPFSSANYIGIVGNAELSNLATQGVFTFIRPSLMTTGSCGVGCVNGSYNTYLDVVEAHVAFYGDQ